VFCKILSFTDELQIWPQWTTAVATTKAQILHMAHSSAPQNEQKLHGSRHTKRSNIIFQTFLNNSINQNNICAGTQRVQMILIVLSVLIVNHCIFKDNSSDMQFQMISKFPKLKISIFSEDQLASSCQPSGDLRFKCNSLELFMVDVNPRWQHRHCLRNGIKMVSPDRRVIFDHKRLWDGLTTKFPIETQVQINQRKGILNF